MSGRPQECDRERVAQLAIARFWRQGLAGTSVEELVADTGLNRFGLYGELGGKKGLFLKACAAYAEESRKRLIDPLRKAADPETGLRQFFQVIVEGQLGPKGAAPRGCLLANTLAEDASGDAEIGQLVHGHFAELEEALAQLLERAAASPRRPSATRAARAGAQCLLTTLFGILQTARLHPSRPVLTAIAERAVHDAIAQVKTETPARRSRI